MIIFLLKKESISKLLPIYSREIGSNRLTKINAKVIGIIIKTVPANKLPKKLANEAVIYLYLLIFFIFNYF